MATKEEIFRFEVPSVLVLTLKGSNENRLERYLKRIGKALADAEAMVSYRSSRSGKWWLSRQSVQDGAELAEFNALPVFFETEYTLRCNFVGDQKVKSCRLVHEMESVCKSFDFDSNILSGGFNFVNAPGKFRFAIDYDAGHGTEQLEVDWMVVSVKMDVQHDGREMVKTIEKTTPGLVHAFLSKSKGQGGLIPKNTDDKAIWYQIFESFAVSYERACKYVVQRPHLKYVDRAEYLRADRIRRWSPQLANRYGMMDEGKRETARFRSEVIDPEIDTVENRFVKYTLGQIARKLRHFAALCKDKQGRVGQVFVEDRVEGYATRFERILRKPFFKSIGKFTGFKQESLALQRKPGYAKINVTWIALQQSIDATREGLDIGEMPIWRIYEFWCFLEMAEILENKYGAPHGKIDSAKTYYDLFVDPEDGDSFHQGLSKLTYEFEDSINHRKISLLYQKNYAEKGDDHYANLNEQKPDIVLVIEKLDAANVVAESYTYLFDAKYRIEERNQDGEKGLDASPKDPIDDMHRYRDAILYRAQKTAGKMLTRQVIGAYVLYPGRPNLADQKPCSFDYSKYIKEENIGAIPMLPGDAGLAAIREFLEEVLGWSKPEQHLSFDIPTLGTTVVLGNDEGEFIKTEVVYGTYAEGQLEWILENRMYNLPVSEAEKFGITDTVSAERKKILYLVAFRGNAVNRTFSLRTGVRKMTRAQLKGIGYPRDGPLDDEYWVFNLDRELGT